MINWKVRLKNPVFWSSVILSAITPILAYFGLNWEQMTTWQALFDLFVNALKNPVVVVAVIISFYNAIIDPTTAGFKDSTQAMSYTEPRKSIEEE